MTVLRGAAALGMMLSIGAASPAATGFGARLERFTYPWPVRMMPVQLASGPAQMAYMDVTPDRPNGRAVVLLHGKNFCGASWEGTARLLSAQGYRVLIPDQIGFCKSSKPAALQYSFGLLATLTKQLIDQSGARHVTLVGHSFGGMLAMRFAMMFPDAVDRLVLVSPLGLVDRTEEGLPYTPISALFAQEQQTSYDSIRRFQQANYYHGTWRPEFDRWVWLQAGMYGGAGRDAVAMAQAKTTEMIYTQPVAHELERIQAPTTLIVGALDETAFGRQQAPASLQRFLVAIPLVAPEAARRMHADLIRLDGVGHVPQLEAPDRFGRALLGALNPVARRND